MSVTLIIQLNWIALHCLSPEHHSNILPEWLVYKSNQSPFILHQKNQENPGTHPYEFLLKSAMSLWWQRPNKVTWLFLWSLKRMKGSCEILYSFLLLLSYQTCQLLRSQRVNRIHIIFVKPPLILVSIAEIWGSSHSYRIVCLQIELAWPLQVDLAAVPPWSGSRL